MGARGQVHICHILSTLGSGGMENGIVNVVNGLTSPDFRHTLICLYQGGVMADRISNPDVEIINLARPDRLAPELPFILARLLRKLAPDVVHTRNYTANFYGTLAARMARVPGIVNGEHGSIQLMQWRRKLASRAVSVAADRILCVSPGLRDYLLEKLKYPPDQVDVIINGVNLDRFGKAATRRGEIRRRLGIPEDVWLVGSVSRFYHFKDHPALLAFLERVKQVDGRPLHGAIVGDGALEQEFRDLTASRGMNDRMHLPGFQQDIENIYPIFDLFLLLSSDNEGTSNVLLEAMASGAPIVTTDIMGNRHLIQDGWNGMLLPPKGEEKVAAMERIIPSLLSDESARKRLARNGSAFVSEGFSLAGMMNRYDRFYRRLVD